jgi:hypothetical protein
MTPRFSWSASKNHLMSVFWVGFGSCRRRSYKITNTATPSTDSLYDVMHISVKPNEELDYVLLLQLQTVEMAV